MLGGAWGVATGRLDPAPLIERTGGEFVRDRVRPWTAPRAP